VGYVQSNPAREAKLKTKKRPDAGEAEPFVLPGKNALRALIEGAKTFDTTGQASAVVATLMYGGLRMSELRGLVRKSCNLVDNRPWLQINQRADRYNVIGSVKSAAGRRTVDIGPETAQVIRVWLMAAPIAQGEPTNRTEKPQFVFPNEDGGVWSYFNFRSRLWVPLMNHCGLVEDEPANADTREYKAAYSDFRAPLFTPHNLRHVYASLQIEQGVTPKRLQKLIGHATLKMTLDTYGHLWPDEDADRERARGVERAI
jgi:integrase